MATSILPQVTNESGSNSYGNYCKMPDGTMIQWGNFTMNSTSEMTQIGSSGIYVSPGFNKTLPVNFVGDYVVTGTSRYSTGHIVPLGCNMSQNADRFNVMIYDFYKRSLNDGLFVVYWQAVGRWK